MKKKVLARPEKARARRSRLRRKPELAAVPAGRPAFPIVGVGASAGGLAALSALLKALPEHSGLGFVLIQHLDPRHESALAQILSKVTPMEVVEAIEGIPVKPDHVYVIPPNKSMIIRSGTLRLAPRQPGPAPHHPIDEFLTALGREYRSAAIGVVLSGSGSDGALGLKTIKTEGGITLAQDPKTAEWPAMPISTIASGAVDFVLAPRRIALELARIGRHPYLLEPLEHQEEAEGDGLERVLLLLQSVTGLDFRMYKQPTVRRRVARRMALRKIASLGKYAQHLKQDPAEAEALAEDIFIHVTGFFRDSECLQALRPFFRRLRVRRPAEVPIRIWVPGCSSGEEVYSIAILLLEDLGTHAARTRIQIYGTDVSESAIERARAGIYSESALRGVSPARRKRFFVKADRGYQINKTIRELCIFARHDLAKDPPFSRLDLISCRNVLIYMGPALQAKVVSIFHYALKPGGILILGKSEAISAHSDLFTVEDRGHKIFSRKAGTPMAPRFEWLAGGRKEHRPDAGKNALTALPPVDFQHAAEQVLLRRYVPPGLVVDSDLRIVHFQGDTGRYLALATGPPSFHLLKVVRPEFVMELRKAIARARKEGASAATGVIAYTHNGWAGEVCLEVSPLRRPAGHKQDFLVIFKEAPPRDQPPAEARKASNREEVKRLKRELASTRESFRSLISEHEAAQEEMKAASEEALSSNEELQSTNEELETAKEELQSSNEELITLNEELRNRNSELNVLSNDLNNVLVGVNIPVLVLDGAGYIRRFTPVAQKLLNLIESDVGRPFSDIASTLTKADWNGWFAEVTEQVRGIEREVQDRDGIWYSVRVRPYRTADNKIDGVIVVFVNIDLIKRPLLEEVRGSQDYSSLLLEASGQAVVAAGADERVVLTNARMEQMFGYSREEIVGRPIGILFSDDFRASHSACFRAAFAETGQWPVIFSLEARRKNGNQFPVQIGLSVIQRLGGPLAVEFVTDISEQRRLEVLSEEYRAEAGSLAAQLITAQEEERRRVSRELHDGICQQLASMALDVEKLAIEPDTPAPTRGRLHALQARAVKASEEARHIAYDLHPSVLDDLGLMASLRELCQDFSKAQKLPVEFNAARAPDAVTQEVAAGFYRIAQESLQNVAKHAKAGHVWVELAVSDHHVRLTIKDDGIGFDLLAAKGKGGFGIANMSERARMLGGELSFRSQPGQGTRIMVRVPLREGR